VPPHVAPTTPNRQRHQALTPARFGLIPFRSPLLRESLLLSSPRGTEMFQFPRFPLLALCVQARVTPHDGCRVSPFGYPRIEAWSAAPRGFSQPPTSFIGFRRQGIHRWLFVAWRLKMLVLAMEFSRRATTGGQKWRSCVETEKWSAPEGHRRLLHPEGVTGRREVFRLLPQNGTENTQPAHQLGVPGVDRTVVGLAGQVDSLERR